MLGFCLIPRPTSTTYTFFKLFQREMDRYLTKQTNSFNIDHNHEYEEFRKAGEPSTFVDRVYKKSEQPRIPFKSHRIWVTDLNNPREMLTIFKDVFLVNQLSKTNQVLDSSASKVGQKWDHYIWTQDKTLIPETVKFFKRIGVEVRELKELPNYKGQIRETIDNYMIDGIGVGVACDILRMLINYDEGGLYLDMDFYIEEWDANLNYYFDFFGFRDREFDVQYFTTWGFGSKPGHIIHKTYLEIFNDFTQMDAAKRPYFINECMYKAVGAVLFKTGPFYYGKIFSKFNNLEGNQDVLIENPTYTNIYDTEFKFEDKGEIKNVTIRLIGRQFGQGSWTRDYQDLQIFGWPELSIAKNL
ncbi:UNKNOWN [Stylonychia lemnae]|uniref:Uncharacterized protein n=1 Tax=Stylonychia lemnae TaxID=5949 RepID=A0A078A8L2_STYLE|nr:UNKNOWN [Stylonychia lemnae]|eukprot:CDW78564.1 UNKNOWN [Stylonychia lemnae]